MNPTVIRGAYLALWALVAAAVMYGVIAAGYSFWLAALLAYLLFFFVNGSLAYRYRARKLRQQGEEPPPFLVYLFFPKRVNFKDRVPLPRPFRILLGIFVFVGGGFLVLTGILLLFTLNPSQVPHPVGAVIALCVLAGIGVGIVYVGVRLIVMKNDEPMLTWLKSNETKSSNTGAA